MISSSLPTSVLYFLYSTNCFGRFISWFIPFESIYNTINRNYVLKYCMFWFSGFRPSRVGGHKFRAARAIALSWARIFLNRFRSRKSIMRVFLLCDSSSCNVYNPIHQQHLILRFGKLCFKNYVMFWSHPPTRGGDPDANSSPLEPPPLQVFSNFAKSFCEKSCKPVHSFP